VLRLKAAFAPLQSGARPIQSLSLRLRPPKIRPQEPDSQASPASRRVATVRRSGLRPPLGMSGFACSRPDKIRLHSAPLPSALGAGGKTKSPLCSPRGRGSIAPSEDHVRRNKPPLSTKSSLRTSSRRLHVAPSQYRRQPLPSFTGRRAFGRCQASDRIFPVKHNGENRPDFNGMLAGLPNMHRLRRLIR